MNTEEALKSFEKAGLKITDEQELYTLFPRVHVESWTEIPSGTLFEEQVKLLTELVQTSPALANMKAERELVSLAKQAEKEAEERAKKLEVKAASSEEEEAKKAEEEAKAAAVAEEEAKKAAVATKAKK